MTRKAIVRYLGAALRLGLILTLGVVVSDWFRTASSTRQRALAPAAGQSAVMGSPQASSTAENPGTPDPTATWKLFTADEYGLSVRYPLDFFVAATPSVKPAEALTAILFAPEKDTRLPGPQSPNMILVVYKNPGAPLPSWLESHATSKRFDDPEVSRKDSPYYFREYTRPRRVLVAGQDALRFSARTMFGEIQHTLLVTPDRVYILDWQANAALASLDRAPTFEALLATLNWTK